MRRREYLTGVSTGVMLAVAGCTGGSDSGNSSGTTGFGDGDGVEQVLELTAGSYSDMGISGDGRSMVTGSSFDMVRLYDAGGDSNEIAEIANIPDVLISEAGDSILATDHGTLTNYNTDGEQQWEQKIEDSDGSELEIGGIDATPDFGVVGVGTEAFIGAIGGDGDSLWEDSLPAGRVWEIKMAESGEYVAVRTEDRENNPSHENAVHVYGDSGEHLWSKTYDVPPLRVDVSESSGIVTVGLDDLRLLVYDLEGELQWEESGFGGYFELSDNGEWILAQDIENTVVFTPEGEEVWRYEMPDSEYGLWLYDRMDVSNNGRSIGSYENLTDGNSTVNMYDEGGEVVWQSDYENEDIRVCLSEDGSTWMVNTRDQIEVYHNYDLAE